jgi:hypothetical protein
MAAPHREVVDPAQWTFTSSIGPGAGLRADDVVLDNEYAVVRGTCKPKEGTGVPRNPCITVDSH